ncbi:MAG: ABC transporter permease [Lewinellaceae bacterium]|nr:ABC transporter permease [Lewinellaceae bacterium]
MFNNYLKIALRSLSKNRLYSMLNISGLAIGVAACLLILLFVGHELSYDRWNSLADRIVRPTYEIKINDFNEQHGCVDALVGPEAAAALPEIQAWCRIHRDGSWNTHLEGQSAESGREEKVFFVDQQFFQGFSTRCHCGRPGALFDTARRGGYCTQSGRALFPLCCCCPGANAGDGPLGRSPPGNGCF